MAIGHGSTAVLLLDGYDMTGFSKNAQVVPTIDLLDSTVFGATAKTRVPGLKHGTLSADMFFDDTLTTGSWDVLKTKYAAQTPGAASPATISLGPQGFAVGARVAMLYGNVNKFESKSVVADLVQLVLGAEAEEDAVDFGVSLHALTAETSFAFTGTSVDNAAASANGGVGVIHCTAIAGAAKSATATLQHSVDGSTWATLISFAAITSANTALRTEVAAGTTVRRYLRITVADTGTTSSFTFACAFARR